VNRGGGKGRKHGRSGRDRALAQVQNDGPGRDDGTLDADLDAGEGEALRRGKETRQSRNESRRLGNRVYCDDVHVSRGRSLRARCSSMQTMPMETPQ